MDSYYILFQIKKPKKPINYVPPPQFKLTEKPKLKAKQQFYLVQVPPGVDINELNGKKFTLKNNKTVSLTEV